MNVLFIMITILFAVLLTFSVIAYCKERSLEEIRADVYKLFLTAENKYNESGQGKQKMKWVIGQARKLLPQWMQMLLTEEAFMRLIQLWFDEVKDLLDDGKHNNSSKKEQNV